MATAYIYDAVRTPRGKGRDGGALNSTTPLELQQQLIAAVLERNEFAATAIDDVILGCVTQVGEQGGNIAKVAALYSGLPDSVSGITINRYCTSGLDACNFAAMKVMTGVDDLVLAGGVESMSRVAMLSDNASFYTDPAVVMKAGFVPMGLAADLIASLDGISREECDVYAVQSQQRAAMAQQCGAFSRSLIAINGTEQDESVRGSVTVAKLATFEPLFTELGRKGYEATFKAAFPDLDELRYVHHSGNSPGIVDGASLALIGSEEAGKKHGLRARARIKTMANVCSDKLLALTGGIDAATDVLRRAGMAASDVDLVEFNEAFAAVSIKFTRDTGWGEDQVNVNGGAISLGHAMGATGTSLVGTVLDELERRDLNVGLVAVSGAAGIGTATIIERV
ncbi:MAG: acetyl-CoA C-acyltransferase [Gammaproteobacteria bacterium]|nr:acetyl-CoA C-acyltransferase [Gammaproteobacteria bacterium]MDH3374301.1 acetyl-CoA C-acyltransferase [Gammaproteobacteria bacterium]MDH3408730.1 acetyl-CoA C-acyltransferase [Gammaproteobacteria bacterium]MDH3551933.1 acetyl-CoA C-acyltransferase [Gammaproteobacteria bacterium]